MAQASRGTNCDYKIDWLWVRSPLEEIKYLFSFIMSLLRSDVEAKRGVEFRQTECLNTTFPLPTATSVRYTV